MISQTQARSILQYIGLWWKLNVWPCTKGLFLWEVSKRLPGSKFSAVNRMKGESEQNIGPEVILNTYQHRTTKNMSDFSLFLGTLISKPKAERPSFFCQGADFRDFESGVRMGFGSCRGPKNHFFESHDERLRQNWKQIFVPEVLEGGWARRRRGEGERRGMVAATRARRREQLSRVLETLHDDLWIEVLSHLSGKDLGRVACVSNQFRAINDAVWQQACARRWPSWTQTARASDTQWRRQYELLELRELELQAVVDVSAISKLQEKVNTKHRTILTEWLAEVSVLFQALRYFMMTQCISLDFVPFVIEYCPSENLSPFFKTLASVTTQLYTLALKARIVTWDICKLPTLHHWVKRHFIRRPGLYDPFPTSKILCTCWSNECNLDFLYIIWDWVERWGQNKTHRNVFTMTR